MKLKLTSNICWACHRTHVIWIMHMANPMAQWSCVYLLSNLKWNWQFSNCIMQTAATQEMHIVITHRVHCTSLKTVKRLQNLRSDKLCTKPCCSTPILTERAVIQCAVKEIRNKRSYSSSYLSTHFTKWLLQIHLFDNKCNGNAIFVFLSFYHSPRLNDLPMSKSMTTFNCIQKQLATYNFTQNLEIDSVIFVLMII